MEDLWSIWASSFALLYVLSYCLVSWATSEIREGREGTDAGGDHHGS